MTWNESTWNETTMERNDRKPLEQYFAYELYRRHLKKEIKSLRFFFPKILYLAKVLNVMIFETDSSKLRRNKFCDAENHPIYNVKRSRIDINLRVYKFKCQDRTHGEHTYSLLHIDTGNLEIRSWYLRLSFVFTI